MKMSFEEMVDGLVAGENLMAERVHASGKCPQCRRVYEPKRQQEDKPSVDCPICSVRLERTT